MYEAMQALRFKESILKAAMAEDLLQELLHEWRLTPDTSYFPQIDLTMLPEWQILCLMQVFLFLILVFLF